MTTEAAFLAGIIASPHDDLPRVVYADWLDENAGEVESPCWCAEYTDDPENPWRGQPGHHPERDPASGRHEGGWTNCKTCNGGGRDAVKPGVVVESDGRAERAEFIRAQVQTAAWGCDFKQTPEQPGWNHNCGTDDKGYWLCQPLRSRAREHLERHADQWFPVPSGFGFDWDTAAEGEADPLRIGYVISRGFVHTVRTTMAEWCGSRCERCPPIPAGEWGPSTVWCPVCHGVRRTPGIGPGIVAAHPVTKVVLTGVVVRSRLPGSPFGAVTRRSAGPLFDLAFPYSISSHVEGNADQIEGLISDAAIKWAKMQTEQQAEADLVMNGDPSVPVPRGVLHFRDL